MGGPFTCPAGCERTAPGGSLCGSQWLPVGGSVCAAFCASAHCNFCHPSVAGAGEVCSSQCTNTGGADPERCGTCKVTCTAPAGQLPNCAVTNGGICTPVSNCTTVGSESVLGHADKRTVDPLVAS